MVNYLPGDIGVEVFGQPLWRFTTRPEPGSQTYEIKGTSIVIDPESINFLKHSVSIIGSAMIGR